MILLLAMEEEIVSVLDSVPAGRSLTVLFVRSKVSRIGHWIGNWNLIIS
jgi:hypothetical protein